MPMAKFEPTDEQREDVAVMASAGRLTQEDIAKTIINPRTGKPISVKVLCRVFKKELAEDVEFKKLILEKFKEQVDAGNWRAIQYGMDNIVGFANGTATATATPKAPDAITAGITVRFVQSPHSDDPRPPVDVTPRPAPPWPQSLLPRPPAHSVPTLDSRDENYVRPMAQEVPPEANPEPLDNPATTDQLLFRPLKGKYRTELDEPGEHSLPWHKRKLKGWGKNGQKY
jgi:hypothetical protein